MDAVKGWQGEEHSKLHVPFLGTDCWAAGWSAFFLGQSLQGPALATSAWGTLHTDGGIAGVKGTHQQLQLLTLCCQQVLGDVLCLHQQRQCWATAPLVSLRTLGSGLANAGCKGRQVMPMWQVMLCLLQQSAARSCSREREHTERLGSPSSLYTPSHSQPRRALRQTRELSEQNGHVKLV